VNSYTITIRSDVGDAQTTVKVDDSDGVPRVTEVLVKADDGAGLTAAQLASINLDLLLQALRPGRPGEATPAPLLTSDSTGAVSRGTTTRARRRTTAKGVVSRNKAKTADAPLAGARVYRKMPDDLGATYAKSGSVTAVAAHYGVPRHTAQGWIGRLRKQGS
jgi:hypothetical protein